MEQPPIDIDFEYQRNIDQPVEAARPQSRSTYQRPVSTANHAFSSLSEKLDQRFIALGYRHTDDDDDLKLLPSTASSEEPSAISFAPRLDDHEHSFSLEEPPQPQFLSGRLSPSASPNPTKVSSTVFSGKSDGMSSSRSPTQFASPPGVAPAVPQSSRHPSISRRKKLIPMGPATVCEVALTGAELFAVLRMRRLVDSTGDTEEYKLPSKRCHRMLLTAEEKHQVQLLRQQLSERCANRTESTRNPRSLSRPSSYRAVLSR